MFTQMSNEKICEGLWHSSRRLKADGTPAACVDSTPPAPPFPYGTRALARQHCSILIVISDEVTSNVASEPDKPREAMKPCRVGHAYTLETMLAQQDETLEESLWVAIKTLEEQASLTERMIEQVAGHAASQSFGHNMPLISVIYTLTRSGVSPPFPCW